MRGAHLVAPPVEIEREVQPDEAKGHRDRRNRRSTMLGSVRIDRELMEPAELDHVLGLEFHHPSAKLETPRGRVCPTVDRPIRGR